MKLAARLISLYFIIYILHSPVLGGNCSHEELKKMGMLVKPDPDKETLFKTSKAMTMTGRKHGIRPGTSKEKLTREPPVLLASCGITGIREQCLACFAQSIYCVANNCRGACLRGPCTKECQECIKKNCKQALLECIGKGDVPNPCQWIYDYLKFKLPETDEEESEKKGEASGTS
uniref:CD8+ T cell target antigen Tp2 n=1 Tax=Theileria parva TaxID=5875 RepID=F6LWM6_THEPA|nr:CD8+ T cell target antigen Tp2 [Theileria parva]